jgi:hypothetical protein
MPDLVSDEEECTCLDDCACRDCTGDVDESDEEDNESDSDSERDSESECESACDTGNDADSESESDIDHVFVVCVDDDIVGYSHTLRKAMGTLEELLEDLPLNYMHRIERTQTSLRVYRKTPYVWFLFSEQLVLHAEIKVIPKI